MSLRHFADAFAALDGGQPALRGAATLHAADAIAALAGGLATREGAAIAAFYATAERSDAGRAARVAGAAAVIRFTECDAIHLPSCVTPAAAVPAALLFASDARRFAAAVEAGMAMGIALGDGLGGAPALSRGVWPTLLATPAIAAAAGGVAMGLDAERLSHALGLALGGSSGRLGRPAGRPSGRWLAIGEATHKGVRAALAARAGFVGDVGLLTEPWLATQTDPTLARPAALAGPARGAGGATGIKPWVAARQGLNALSAFCGLLHSGSFVPDSIERIGVALPPAAVPVVARPLDPADRLSRIAHLGLQLGHAAFAPDRLFDIGREAAPDPRALGLAAKVEVMGDPALASRAVDSWPARVMVHAAGTTHEAHCDRLLGDPGEAGRTDLVAAKIKRFCSPALARTLQCLLAGEGTPETAIGDAARAVDRALGGDAARRQVRAAV